MGRPPPADATATGGSPGHGGATQGAGGTGTGGVVTTGTAAAAAGGATGGGAGRATTGTGGATTGAGGATTGTGGSSADQSVLERNNHPSRDGVFVQPKLTKAVAATLKLESAFKATFTGAMWASPLYLQNGPGGKGVFFAVTTGNDVFALDETTGATVWTKTWAARRPPTA